MRTDPEPPESPEPSELPEELETLEPPKTSDNLNHLKSLIGSTDINKSPLSGQLSNLKIPSYHHSRDFWLLTEISMETNLKY